MDALFALVALGSVVMLLIALREWLSLTRGLLSVEGRLSTLGHETAEVQAGLAEFSRRVEALEATIARLSVADSARTTIFPPVPTPAVTPAPASTSAPGQGPGAARHRRLRLRRRQ